jgi:hypothetical protein
MVHTPAKKAPRNSARVCGKEGGQHRARGGRLRSAAAPGHGALRGRRGRPAALACWGVWGGAGAPLRSGGCRRGQLLGTSVRALLLRCAAAHLSCGHDVGCVQEVVDHDERRAQRANHARDVAVIEARDAQREAEDGDVHLLVAQATCGRVRWWVRPRCEATDGMLGWWTPRREPSRARGCPPGAALVAQRLTGPPAGRRSWGDGTRWAERWPGRAPRAPVRAATIEAIVGAAAGARWGAVDRGSRVSAPPQLLRARLRTMLVISPHPC